ncbi:MAG: aldo/keto reductase [Anaerolineaceae bacterium]|nr:aldo/keto reductase [Anaerolineaceae bacterium]
MEFLSLNNAVLMPILGFGVYQIEEKDECERSVLDALEAGYRLIDTASLYVNEKAVGNAIRKSGLPREEIFVTTKFWIRDAGYEKTMASFSRSQENLGLEVIDLFLIHQPFGDYYGSWRAMQTLYGQGKVRAIGVSNFYPDRLADLVQNTGFIPALNQVEMNPFFQQHEAQAWNQKYGVQIQAWAPLGRGLQDILENELLKNLADKYQKTVAQIILRWLTQRGLAAIPKSTHRERIVENIRIFDFSLDENEMAAIRTLDKGRTCFSSHTDPETVIRLSSRHF